MLSYIKNTHMSHMSSSHEQMWHYIKVICTFLTWELFIRVIRYILISLWIRFGMSLLQKKFLLKGYTCQISEWSFVITEMYFSRLSELIKHTFSFFRYFPRPPLLINSSLVYMEFHANRAKQNADRFEGSFQFHDGKYRITIIYFWAHSNKVLEKFPAITLY